MSIGARCRPDVVGGAAAQPRLGVSHRTGRGCRRRRRRRRRRRQVLCPPASAQQSHALRSVVTPTGERSIVMGVSVCLCVCVCLSAIISSELHGRSSPNFCACFCACYLWPLFGPSVAALCTSGFVDDVIFAQKPRLLGTSPPSQSAVHTKPWAWL